MKAAVMRQYDEKLENPVFVSYEEVPDAKIKNPDDVIVRIGGAGVCRTDLHIIEGVWRSKVDLQLPHIMGHENAGWIEEVGKNVTHLKVGDPVICHPLITSGHCLACRRGNDMHAEESEFPGINTNGGYAQYLRTGARSIIKLPKSLAPKDVAPHTDAGLTAYRAAKKASRHLLPGEYAVVIGAGGLGHIGIQVLRAMCAARIIIVDRSETALKLATDCGADYAVKADGGQVEEVLRLLPQVKEAAVVGIPDARLGEVPVAFVVGDASDDELMAVCREHLVPYKIPVAFRRVTAIPRSEVGKVLRRQLAQSWTPAP